MQKRRHKMYININGLENCETTEDIHIPHDPLERVVGHKEIIHLIKIAAKQRRNLLLVGPPGIGKSLIAQAISFHLKKPKEQISTVHNPERPEKPFIEIKNFKEIDNDLKNLEKAEGQLLKPQDIPDTVCERLGFKCVHCGNYSGAYESICPDCGGDKFSHLNARRKHLGDLLGMLEMGSESVNIPQNRVTTTRIKEGAEEVVIYERFGNDLIKVLDQKALEKRRELVEEKPMHIIVPLKRKFFVQATGASETELLGDVRHDPYGGHPDLGTQPYERVVSGAIHEAHEGVLFIDEVVHIAHLQRFILSAMQDKIFPIVGRNPQSAGSSVRVENVPCDFIFVGACNITDLKYILAPLRSRIQGEGYEILMNTTMPINNENKAKLAQFVAQEIKIDNKIPHATIGAIEILIKEAKKRARTIDDQNDAYTLRLRDLGGVIRMAGDVAVMENSEYITSNHMKLATKKAISIEDQIIDRYQTLENALQKDLNITGRSFETHHKYQNEHIDRSYM